MMTSYYRDDLCGLPEMSVVARQLWATSGLGPDDMQAAILYDHFTPTCSTSSKSSASAPRRGQGLRRRRPDRARRCAPINTHGGQLGEAYLHGMNGIAEGVRSCVARRSIRCPSSSTWW